VYRMLGQPVPDELFATNISTSHVPVSVAPPVGLLRPTLDGRPTSYFEWLPAGRVETDVPSGAMTGAERRVPEVRTLLFGFDLDRLYLRLDLAGPAAQRLAQGLCCSIRFTSPADRRLVITGTPRGPLAELHQKAPDGSWAALPGAGPRVAADEILEAAIPFADLGLRPNMPFAFFVTMLSHAVEIERHPGHRPVESVAPEAAFEELNWKA